jgi:hypothetical protein
LDFGFWILDFGTNCQVMVVYTWYRYQYLTVFLHVPLPSTDPCST